MAPQSLAAKLSTLAVGESMWLEDRPTASNGQGPIEAQARQNHERSTAEMADRRFKAARADAITMQREHYHLVRITRTQ